MKLDQELCSRARLARDARFDGKFFIAVLTTGIYCRPICPARTSREENIRYFPTAAAAAEAGFRPCLRCRPECSPGTPAGSGTSNTVSRAMRLIGETGLEEGGVELLAERLGIGSRHLRRLFLKHLGATPSAVAQTRRLHFAKKLIDETLLPMTEIAFASGFGSVRRFNAAINKTYSRTPTEMRKSALRKNKQAAAAIVSAEAEDQYRFSLSFRPPFPAQTILAFLAARAVPGIEIVTADSYGRSIALQGSRGFFEVTPDEKRNRLLVQVQFPDSRALFSIIERIRAMFDLNADWTAIERILRADPLLCPWLERGPGLRVPGCWDGFELATVAILSEGSSVEVASSLAGRLVQCFGERFSAPHGLTHVFPSAATLAQADLASQGVSHSQAEAIRTLARGVRDGRIRFEMVADTDAFLHQLSQIEGFGHWACQYVAMRALREPDAFPFTDPVLCRAAEVSDACDFERRAELWRPWRSYAAMYLWTIPALNVAEQGDAVPSCIALPPTATDLANGFKAGDACGSAADLRSLAAARQNTRRRDSR